MAFLDPVNTIAVKDIVPGVVDNVFRNSPFLAFARKNCLRSYDGGPSWQENFLYDVLLPSAYQPGDTFDITQKQIATGATVTPRYYNVPVPAYIEKLKIEMNGPKAVFDYVDLLMQAAALTMSAKLSNDAYRHGQNLSGSDRSKNLNGLDEAYNDGSTNGFDGRTYAAYLSLTRTDVLGALNSPMTGPAASVGGAINYPTLEQAYASVTIGSEQPDLILTTNNGLSYIKMAFQAQQRFESNSNPDLGFRSLKFNGADVIADQYAPGARTASTQDTSVGYSAVSAGETIWFLNTKYIRFYLSTDSLFGFGFTGFLPAQNNSVVVGHYKFAGNLTVTAPRLGRVLYAVTG
jgi:hypothetical protein